MTPALVGFDYSVCRKRLDHRIVAELGLAISDRCIPLVHMLRCPILSIVGILMRNRGRISDARKIALRGENGDEARRLAYYNVNIVLASELPRECHRSMVNQ